MLWLIYNAFRDYYQGPGVSFWGNGNGRTLTSGLFGVVIWSTYMLNSARVRSTFVN